MESETAVAEKPRSVAKLNPCCIVCGMENSKGLRIGFQRDGDGAVARWVPGEDLESFQGTIHGGIVTAVLDEAMSKAVIFHDWEAFTVELKVRFRSRVVPGEGLQIRGWVNEKKKRKILTEAALCTATGVERAHAWATFLVPPAA